LSDRTLPLYLNGSDSLLGVFVMLQMWMSEW